MEAELEAVEEGEAEGDDEVDGPEATGEGVELEQAEAISPSDRRTYSLLILCAPIILGLGCASLSTP